MLLQHSQQGLTRQPKPQGCSKLLSNSPGFLETEDLSLFLFRKPPNLNKASGSSLRYRYFFSNFKDFEDFGDSLALQSLAGRAPAASRGSTPPGTSYWSPERPATSSDMAHFGRLLATRPECSQHPVLSGPTQRPAWRGRRRTQWPQRTPAAQASRENVSPRAGGKRPRRGLTVENFQGCFPSFLPRAKGGGGGGNATSRF